MADRVAFTSILALVVAVGVVSTSTLGPSARMAPLIVGIPTLALFAFELARDIARRSPTGDGHTDWASERRLIAWLALILVCVALAGITLGVSLWLSLFLAFRSRERWTTALAFAGALATVLYAVLTVVLRMPLLAAALWAD